MSTGRPKSKIKKVKIGFLVKEECRDSIDTIAEDTGKNKSRIVEEAIKLYEETKGKNG